MLLRAATAAVAASGVAFCIACFDPGRNTCFDSNGWDYGYALGGDTTLVFHWPADRMPVRFYADATGDLRANVLSGLNTWVNAFNCQEAEFQLVTDSTTADVVVRRADVLPAARAGTVVLASDSVGVCRGVTEQQIDSALTLTGPFRIFIAPLGVADSLARAGCYRMVATHELGHTLGLFAHSADSADIMYPVPRRSTLSIDDRYTIQKLYHRAATIQPAPRED